jgi:hypothetical protein
MSAGNPKRLAGLSLLAVAVLLPALAAGPTHAREPLALPEVGDTFEAPYDAVWDATLRNLGVLKLLVSDKAAGRIETEPFPFNFTVGGAPSRPGAPLLVAAREPFPGLLAQEGSDARPTQVLWIALHINVSRAGDSRTSLRVRPLVHDSLLGTFMPGPTNNPWVDLFGKIRTTLGLR